MMDFRENLKDLMPLDRARFDELKNEFKPPYDLIGLKYLREKAGKERDLRELYRDRAPYELLQNADDADATQAVFILTPEGLVFAHNGNWFTVDNFRSLADGWSDKDPNQCIGHKGLGFRSVLDITPSPYLLKLEAESFFAVKFTWALNNGHIHEAFKRDPSLREHYKKWTRHGQIACPVMAIPGPANCHTHRSGCRRPIGPRFASTSFRTDPPMVSGASQTGQSGHLDCRPGRLRTGVYSGRHVFHGLAGG